MPYREQVEGLLARIEQLEAELRAARSASEWEEPLQIDDVSVWTALRKPLGPRSVEKRVVFDRPVEEQDLEVFGSIVAPRLRYAQLQQHGRFIHCRWGTFHASLEPRGDRFLVRMADRRATSAALANVSLVAICCVPVFSAIGAAPERLLSTIVTTCVLMAALAVPTVLGLHYSAFQQRRRAFAAFEELVAQLKGDDASAPQPAIAGDVGAPTVRADACP
ncbi:MAG: hypothetical protein AAF411_06865 [Myxococcota bacterium]